MRTVMIWAAASLLAAACGKGDAAPEGQMSAPAPAVSPAAAKPGARAAIEAEVESDPRGPIAVALPNTELELGDEPDDAPHVDRALRMAAPREGDRVIARGFVIEGVPEDYTIYWPKGGDAANTYLVYDAGHDHVATIVETPAATAGPDRFDPAELSWEALEAFDVWPSEFASSQTKRGPGKRTRFSGPRFSYRIDRLVPLPWLNDGFAYRVDPAPGS